MDQQSVPGQPWGGAGQTAAGGVLGGQLAQAASNKINVSRTATAASRLHELVDVLEQLVAGAHSHIDRFAGGGQPEKAQANGASPPAESQMHRLEQGLQRFEAVLKSDAAALFHRLSEL